MIFDKFYFVFFAIVSYFPSTVYVQYLVGMWCNFCVKSHAPLGLFASTALFLYPYLFWFRIKHRVFALIISALRIDWSLSSFLGCIVCVLNSFIVFVEPLWSRNFVEIFFVFNFVWRHIWWIILWNNSLLS